MKALKFLSNMWQKVRNRFYPTPQQAKQFTDSRRFKSIDLLFFDVILQLTSTTTSQQVYCLGYNSITGERRPSWDGYYPRHSLYIIEFGEEKAA